MVQSKELEFIPPKKRNIKEMKKESNLKKTNIDHVKLQVSLYPQKSKT